MADGSFAAKIRAFADKVPEAAEAVFLKSVEDLTRELSTTDKQGGRVPHDTGFLVQSLRASTAAAPRILDSARPVGTERYDFEIEDILTVVRQAAEQRTSVFIGYTAAYAAHQEYGANGRPGLGFLRLAVQQWPQFVEKRAAAAARTFGLS